MGNSAGTHGVFFLANNKVFELALAFLRSFRTHNPDLPLCLIPYDADFGEIAALKENYSFTVFSDQQMLAECDEISMAFHGRVLGAYRKLVAWEGRFSEFLYIDIDTVVTGSVDFAFQHLHHGEYIASHSNLPDIRRWVWKDTVDATSFLTPPQMAFAANTGFFASTRGLLPMKHCRAKVAGALAIKDHMELHCMEQPFLNYLVVTSGYRYTSLLALRLNGTAPDVAAEFWAGIPGARVKGGMLHDLHGKPVFLVHWAGIWQNSDSASQDFPYKDLWDYYRRSDIPSEVPVRAFVERLQNDSATV